MDYPVVCLFWLCVYHYLWFFHYIIVIQNLTKRVILEYYWLSFLISFPWYSVLNIIADKLNLNSIKSLSNNLQFCDIRLLLYLSLLLQYPQMFVRSASSCVEVRLPKTRHAVTQGRFHLGFF